MFRAELKNGVLTISVPCPDLEEFSVATGEGLDAKVMDMLTSSGGFQATNLRRKDQTPLHVNVLAGFPNEEQKAKKRAAQRQARR